MTDLLIARRTQRSKITVEVLHDHAPNWRKNYPEVGVLSIELRPGEADRIDLRDLQKRLNAEPRIQLEDALKEWRVAQ